MKIIKKGSAGTVAKGQHYVLAAGEYNLMNCSLILEQVAFWEDSPVIHHEEEKDATTITLTGGKARRLAVDYETFDQMMTGL